MCTFLQLCCISIWEGLSQREGYTAVQIVDLAACLRIMNTSKYSQDSLCSWKSVNILEFTYVSALKSPPAVWRCRRHGFKPWVGKIPWRRKWQPTPQFLTGKSPGQRNLVDYSPQSCKGWDTTEEVSMQTLSTLRGVPDAHRVQRLPTGLLSPLTPSQLRHEKLDSVPLGELAVQL